MRGCFSDEKCSGAATDAFRVNSHLSTESQTTEIQKRKTLIKCKQSPLIIIKYLVLNTWFWRSDYYAKSFFFFFCFVFFPVVLYILKKPLQFPVCYNNFTKVLYNNNNIYLLFRLAPCYLLSPHFWTSEIQGFYYLADLEKHASTVNLCCSIIQMFQLCTYLTP